MPSSNSRHQGRSLTSSAADFRLGVALSGGGSRAIAFHLGCLRQLNRLGLLQRASVLSTVSGGSVIGALLALHDGPFEAFELKVHRLLRKGLVRPSLVTAVTTREGPLALLCVILLAGSELAIAPFRAASALLRGLAGGRGLATPRATVLRRFASRTTILRQTLDRVLFHGATLGDLPTHRPRWIAVAAELRTRSAFYFSARSAGSWRFGAIAPGRITVAHAVAASAAFPLLLPALDEVLDFERRDGTRARERVTLTDGGVYDNLGLAPLWPDRDPRVSLDVEAVDALIVCRADDGLSLAAPSLFLPSRLAATVATIHGRAQNLAMTRLFDLKAAGRLKAVALPYLGQADTRLACAPPDLVTRAETAGYPTDFSPMPEAWIERLARRGEQLTLAVLQENAPELIAWATEWP